MARSVREEQTHLIVMLTEERLDEPAEVFPIWISVSTAQVDGDGPADILLSEKLTSTTREGIKRGLQIVTQRIWRSRCLEPRGLFQSTAGDDHCPRGRCDRKLKYWHRWDRLAYATEASVALEVGRLSGRHIGRCEDEGSSAADRPRSPCGEAVVGQIIAWSNTEAVYNCSSLSDSHVSKGDGY